MHTLDLSRLLDLELSKHDFAYPVAGFRMRHRGLRSRSTSILPAIAAAAVVIAAVVGVALLSSDSAPREFRTFRGAAVSLPVEPGVRAVDASPVNIVPDLALWTGEEMFLFGSSDPSVEATNVGLLYNPQDGVWREVASPEFELLLKGVTGVWAGDSAVIIGMECGPESRVLEEGDRELNRCIPGSLAAARYVLASNSWERLPVPDVAEKSFGLEGFDDRVGDALGWDGREARFIIRTELVGYSIADGSWRTLPDPPGSETCLVGERTVSYKVVGREFAPASENTRTPLLTADGVVAWVLGEGGASWGDEIAADLPTELLQTVSFGCTTRGVFAFTPDSFEYVLFFDSADLRWRDLPVPPVEVAAQPPPPGLSQPEGLRRPIINLGFPAWTGREFLLVMPGFAGVFPSSDGRGEREVMLPAYAARLDPDSGVWRVAEPGPTTSRTQVWLDGYSLVAQVTETGRVDLYTYSPD